MVEGIDPGARPEVPRIGLLRIGQMGLGARQLPEVAGALEGEEEISYLVFFEPRRLDRSMNLGG
jgi:hypothetical protein